MQVNERGKPVTETNLPKEFILFEELIFCSNVIRNCNVPIVIDDRPVVLVGRGDQPKIWLWGLVDPKSKRLVPIVRSNSVLIPMTPPIKVESENNYTRVKLNDIIIIHAVKSSETTAIVDQLDMRPLGFSIYGDSSTLHVGTTTMVGNLMSGGKVFIALRL